jgi:hypothetical protein
VSLFFLEEDNAIGLQNTLKTTTLELELSKNIVSTLNPEKSDTTLSNSPPVKMEAAAFSFSLPTASSAAALTVSSEGLSSFPIESTTDTTSPNKATTPIKAPSNAFDLSSFTTFSLFGSTQGLDKTDAVPSVSSCLDLGSQLPSAAKVSETPVTASPKQSASLPFSSSLSFGSVPSQAPVGSFAPPDTKTSGFIKSGFSLQNSFKGFGESNNHSSDL